MGQKAAILEMFQDPVESVFDRGAEWIGEHDATEAILVLREKDSSGFTWTMFTSGGDLTVLVGLLDVAQDELMEIYRRSEFRSG